MNKRFITWLVIMGIIVGTGTFITIKEKEKAAKDNVNIDKFNENIEEYSNKENKIETLSSNEFKNEKEFEENIIKLHLISSITDSMKDKKVVIQGEIVELVEHKNGHLFLTVKDSSGSILVPIFKDKNIDMNKIKVNNKYEFAGIVDIYKDKVEIIPQEDKDIKPLEDKSISKDNIGEKINVKCVVLSKYNHPKGHTFFTVKTENSQEIEVPIFENLKVNTEKIGVGAELEVFGKINEYKGKLQVVIDNKDGLKILDNGELGDSKLISLKEINEDNRGKVVQIRGDVKNISEKNGHLYFELKDGANNVECVLFKADGDVLEGKRLRIKHGSEAKFPIRVSGTVNKYNDKIQLVVDKVFNEY